MVKNLPDTAGDTGWIPGPGRSHMPQGNGACAPQLLKPTCPRALLCNKRSHCNEKPEMGNGTRLPQLEKNLCEAARTQYSQKFL